MNTSNSKKSKIVGIDLGTTNSVIAVMEGANPVVIPNAEGFRTTPSVVAYLPTNDIVIGQIAKRQNVLNPENTFYSVKRFIGSKFQEIEQETKLVTYKVFKESTGNVKIYCPRLNKNFSPEEISAAVLKKLATDAGKFLKEEITKAVITVPAYFNDSQRLATKDAGRIAGLDVLRILNEPTAAALAYGLGKKKNEVVLIFDLGGGTFDVSLLEVGEEVFEVLATSGDTHLGGDDFDQIIVNYIIETFKQTSGGGDLRKDKQALQRLLEAAEKIKIELSSVSSTVINIPYIYFAKEGEIPQSIEMNFDRSTFESLSHSLLERCKNPVFKVIEDANISKSDIDEIILVGGSTRIPAVRNLLIDLLGKPLNESVNPDEVVALGAAVQAGILAGEITDLILLDVTPLSLGVETLGGLMTPVIKRNVSIPVNQSEIFSTAVDNQDFVDIHILQGERSLAADNKSLGVFRLQNIPRAPKGVPKIEVRFQLDADGLLSVSAREESSGVEQSIKIQGASVLSREEVNRMVEDAEQNGEKDKAKKYLTTITFDFDTLLSKSERFLSFLKNSSISPKMINSTEFLYFTKVLTRMKFFYNQNKYLELSTEIYRLLYGYNLVISIYYQSLLRD
jgi:molecular chaperone DnaK